MSPSLKYHVASLLKSLIDELVARFGRFPRLATASQENPPLFILNRHEVGRDLDVDNVGPVRVRAEVVHEQVVRIVDEEMKSIHHFAVVADERHFNRLLDDFRDCLLRSLLLLQELDLHLLFGFLEEELGLADDLLTLL